MFSQPLWEAVYVHGDVEDTIAETETSGLAALRRNQAGREGLSGKALRIGGSE
jgi:hypothetical protein